MPRDLLEWSNLKACQETYFNGVTKRHAKRLTTLVHIQLYCHAIVLLMLNFINVIFSVQGSFAFKPS